MNVLTKRTGFGLDVKSMKSNDNKRSYIFFKGKNGSYHAFLEVAAKPAVEDCDPKLKSQGNTRQMCKQLLGF